MIEEKKKERVLTWTLLVLEGSFKRNKWIVGKLES